MIDLVCIRAFGDYNPGDDAGSVADDAKYSTYYFAPRDLDTDPPPPAGMTRAEHLAQLEAELAALEKENQ